MCPSSMAPAPQPSSCKHVVLFPFPGHGHLAAFLAMAGLLRRELPDGTLLTVVSTPRNIADLRASSVAQTCSLGFHALPFVPTDHGLPDGCESMASLPPASVITLLEAFETLEPGFDDYVSGLAAGQHAVCIIADPFLAWTANVAGRLGCAHAIFVSCSASGTAVLHALWSNMPLATGDGTIHPSLIPPSFLRPGELLDRRTAFYRRLLPHGRRTDAVLVNTVEELEPTGLAMARRALGGTVPVLPVGPLVRTSSGDCEGGVLRWLDSRPPSSVLYISFGSQNTIRRDQMMELAAALERTGVPFVWAVRPPVGFDIGGAFRDEWLPDGFEARARGRGVVVRGWAPQVGILAHAATAAFLSHCGWNSVLESMAHGVPIAGWPLGGDQFCNARMMAEEWGVCVEVARGSTGPVDLPALLETVMGTETAAAMKQRAAEIQRLMRRASPQNGGLHGFLTAMRLQ